MAEVPPTSKTIMGPSARKAPVSRAIERAGVWLWNNYLHKIEFGLLPKEYNFKVHGPYMPWRYYGKPDTPLKEVKLGELSAYLARRNKSPAAFFREAGRLHHYWQSRFCRARYNGMAPFYQFTAFFVIAFAINTLDRQRILPTTLHPFQTHTHGSLTQLPPVLTTAVQLSSCQKREEKEMWIAVVHQRYRYHW